MINSAVFSHQFAFKIIKRSVSFQQFSEFFCVSAIFKESRIRKYQQFRKCVAKEIQSAAVDVMYFPRIICNEYWIIGLFKNSPIFPLAVLNGAQAICMLYRIADTPFHKDRLNFVLVQIISCTDVHRLLIYGQVSLSRQHNDWLNTPGTYCFPQQINTGTLSKTIIYQIYIKLFFQDCTEPLIIAAEPVE